MNPHDRENRKQEILTLAQQALERRETHRRTRRTRRRNLAILAGASMVVALGFAGEYFKQALTVAPNPEPPLIVILPPPELTSTPEMATAVPHLETPSWIVPTKPLRADQLLESRVPAVLIASDAELQADLEEAGTPGIVRLNGRVYAAFELAPVEPEPVSPPSSGPVVPPTPPTAEV